MLYIFWSCIFSIFPKTFFSVRSFVNFFQMLLSPFLFPEIMLYDYFNFGLWKLSKVENLNMCLHGYVPCRINYCSDFARFALSIWHFFLNHLKGSCLPVPAWSWNFSLPLSQASPFYRVSWPDQLQRLCPLHGCKIVVTDAITDHRDLCPSCSCGQKPVCTPPGQIRPQPALSGLDSYFESLSLWRR